MGSTAARRVVFEFVMCVCEIETLRSTLVLVYTALRPSDAERSVGVRERLQLDAKLLGCSVCVVAAQVLVYVGLRTGMIQQWTA